MRTKIDIPSRLYQLKSSTSFKPPNEGKHAYLHKLSQFRDQAHKQRPSIQKLHIVGLQYMKAIVSKTLLIDIPLRNETLKLQEENIVWYSQKQELCEVDQKLETSKVSSQLLFLRIQKNNKRRSLQLLNNRVISELKKPEKTGIQWEKLLQVCAHIHIQNLKQQIIILNNWIFEIAYQLYLHEDGSDIETEQSQEVRKQMNQISDCQEDEKQVKQEVVNQSNDGVAQKGEEDKIQEHRQICNLENSQIDINEESQIKDQIRQQINLNHTQQNEAKQSLIDMNSQKQQANKQEQLDEPIAQINEDKNNKDLYGSCRHDHDGSSPHHKTDESDNKMASRQYSQFSYASGHRMNKYNQTASQISIIYNVNMDHNAMTNQLQMHIFATQLSQIRKQNQSNIHASQCSLIHNIEFNNNIQVDDAKDQCMQAIANVMMDNHNARNVDGNVQSNSKNVHEDNKYDRHEDRRSGNGYTNKQNTGNYRTFRKLENISKPNDKCQYRNNGYQKTNGQNKSKETWSYTNKLHNDTHTLHSEYASNYKPANKNNSTNFNQTMIVNYLNNVPNYRNQINLLCQHNKNKTVTYIRNRHQDRYYVQAILDLCCKSNNFVKCIYMGFGWSVNFKQACQQAAYQILYQVYVQFNGIWRDFVGKKYQKGLL